MFHRFGLYRVNSLHSFISQTEIHTGPSLGVFETWVRLSYFGAFVNTQVNVRQSHLNSGGFSFVVKMKIMGYACDTQKAVPVGKNDKPPATQKEMVCRLLLKVSKEEYQC